jgi:citrate synthase
MDPVKQKLKEVGSKRAEQLKRLVAEHGNDVIQEVTLEQVISGMKGIVALLTDTSSLDPEEGIRFRDYSIPELRQHLPKLKDDGEPLPEGLFYLMLLGEIPDRATVDFISRDWARRAADIPDHAFDVINALPKSAHPMIQFNTAILAMSTQSHFRKAYMEGFCDLIKLKSCHSRPDNPGYFCQCSCYKQIALPYQFDLFVTF